jgi:hypothetical protein
VRGEIGRAIPTIGVPAVNAFRAGNGSGWQNGNWLLMACINLFGPGETPEKSTGGKARFRSRPTAPVQPYFGA